MAAALPTADPVATRLIVLTLLERHEAAGTIGLVEQFHRLPVDLKQTVVGQINHLDRPLREASKQDDVQVSLNVVQIVRQARTARLAYLVGHQLRHSGSHTVRRAAADCLLDMAVVAKGKQPQGHAAPWSNASKAYFLDVVDKALVQYASHQQPQVLLAMAALLPGSLPAVRTVLGDRRHAAVEPLRHLLEKPQSPHVRAALLVMVTIEAVAESALVGLRAAFEGPKASDVVGSSYLLLHHRTRAAVAACRQPCVPADDGRSARTWPHESLRGLPRWLAAWDLDPTLEVRLLNWVHTVPDAPARLAALRRLIELSGAGPGSSADEAVSRFCFDAAQCIGGVALRHLIRQRWSGLWHLLPQLINRGHARVRRIASAQLAPRGFERLWSTWPQLEPAQRLAAGRALIKIDPKFHHHLGRNLASGDRADVLRALAIMQTLNQGGLFEAALMTLTNHDDPNIASAAVKALDATASPKAHGALQIALNHDDSRVRANAVEALEQARSTKHVLRLSAMAQEEANRPRANAIKALMSLKFQDAMNALAKMLNDPRPEHRVSALWLVRQMGVVDLASDVAELAISDADDQVKTRAADVVGHLIELLNTAVAEEHVDRETEPVGVGSLVGAD